MFMNKLIARQINSNRPRGVGEIVWYAIQRLLMSVVFDIGYTTFTYLAVAIIFTMSPNWGNHNNYFNHEEGLLLIPIIFALLFSWILPLLIFLVIAFITRMRDRLRFGGLINVYLMFLLILIAVILGLWNRIILS